jgi:hypothetical protein
MKTGTIAFQANDKSDVFWVTRIEESGTELSDEIFLGVEDTLFESDKAFVTGKVPAFKPLHIDGDTSIINAWFKADDFDEAFEIIVYLECEAVEELEVVIEEDLLEEKTASDLLDPIIVNL